MGTTNTLDLNNRVNALEKAVSGGDSAQANKTDIASEFSTTTAYTAGCFVYYQGKLYQFNADHAAGAWDASDVVEANVTDQIVSNKSAIDALDTGVDELAVDIAGKKLTTESGATLETLVAAWGALTDALKDQCIKMKINGHYMTRHTQNAFKRTDLSGTKLVQEYAALSGTATFGQYEYTLGQASASSSVITVTSWEFTYIEL